MYQHVVVPKKYLFVIVVIGLAFFLAACGGGSSSSGGADDTNEVANNGNAGSGNASSGNGNNNVGVGSGTGGDDDTEEQWEAGYYADDLTEGSFLVGRVQIDIREDSEVSGILSRRVSGGEIFEIGFLTKIRSNGDFQAENAADGGRVRIVGTFDRPNAENRLIGNIQLAYKGNVYANEFIATTK